MSFCIKEHKFGVGSLHWAETGQRHRKVISFDLQRGRKQSKRGAVLGGHDYVTSWEIW